MKALMIEFDARSGRRAGDINPRDPNLRCNGWQDLEREPAIEIRVIEDDRDTSVYLGIPGITILESRVAVNEAILTNVPVQYGIKDKELCLAHLREKGIPLNVFAGKTLDESAKELFAQGLAGIAERKPNLV